MTGFVAVMGPCFACKKLFSYNPHRVPSIPIDPVTQLPPDLGGDPQRASREPICEDCIGVINDRRVRSGLAPFPVYEDAYDSIPENEF